MNSPTDARQVLARAMKEEGKDGLRVQVENLATQLGYVVRHLRDSRKQNVVGLPDLLLLHPQKHRLLWIELKRQQGTTTLDQDLFLNALMECGQVVYLLRPMDLLDGTILAILQ